jgi:hypothetical protein
MGMPEKVCRYRILPDKAGGLKQWIIKIINAEKQLK